MSREKTQTSALQRLWDKNQREIRTSTVGKVLKILDNGWLEVQPQISMVKRNPETGEESEEPLPRLVRVPVGFYKAGGFVISLPISVGDEGVLTFFDRSLDVWKSTGKISVPDSSRLHDISDSMFTPFPTSESGAVVNDPNNMVIGKEDGSSTIKIAKVGGKVTVDTEIYEVNATTSFDINTPTMNITASTEVKMITPKLDVSGDVIVGGKVVATGTVSGSDHLVPGSPSYVAHKHGGVTIGAGISGVIV